MAEVGKVAPEETPRPESVPPPGVRTLEGATLAAPEPSPPPADTGRRPTAYVVAVVAALVVGAGLAFGLPWGSSDAPLTAIAEAAQRTGNLSGARFSGTGTGSTPGFEMQMSFEGTYNAETERSFLKMETTTPRAPQIAAAMNPLVAVQDGSTMYMSSPIFSRALPGGKSWMKIDGSEFGSEPISGQLESADGRAVLGQLATVSDDSRTVGREQIRGVSTTHLTATLDPGLQAEQLREAGNDLAAEVLEGQGERSTVDVWIDRRGLIRRTVMTMGLQLPGQEPTSMSMTMDFYGFGAAPDVSVPSDAVSFDATALALEGLQRIAPN
ncbi:MAG: hypothetical protein WBC01_09885 [Solirubrobacterales bacterium]